MIFNNKMHSSLVVLPLLIASTMAFPYDFPPFNYPPYDNYYPPYNYYHHFPTPPSPRTNYGAPPPPPRHPAPHRHPTPRSPRTKYGAPPPPPRHPTPHSPGTNYGAPPPPPRYPAPCPPPPAANGNNNVHKAYLTGQNAARKAVKGANLRMLVWNNTVAAYALQYAKERTDCQLVHSQTELYGENIAEGSVLSVEEAVGLWVDEKSNYDYNTNACTNGGMCGHYTQVIWKRTTQIGCARVKCDSGGFFVTCNYSPPGNYIGERPY